MAKVSKDIIKTMKQMRKEGLSYKLIAEQFGVSPDSVRYHTDNAYKKKRIMQTMKWQKEHKEQKNKSSRLWRQKHKKRYYKQVCLSMLKSRLYEGVVSVNDVAKILTDYIENKEVENEVSNMQRRNQKERKLQILSKLQNLLQNIKRQIGSQVQS